MNSILVAIKYLVRIKNTLSNINGFELSVIIIMIEISTTNTPKQASKEAVTVRRRIQKDEGNRNYKCPCGKTYLSYPALFTHIKQKHDGKAPGEIGKPKGNNKGRPPMRKPDEKLQNNNSSILSGLCECMETIIQKNNKKIQNLYNQFLDKSDLLVKSTSTSSEEPQKNKEKSCREIFNELLLEVESSSIPNDTNMVQERVFVFLSIWMEHFNEKQEELEGDEPVYTAEFLNEFIVDYLPEFVRRNGLEDIRFLRSEYAISISHSVHKWVFEKKYTFDQVFKSVSGQSDIEVENQEL